jgi:peroxiredoxin (alkyl hydroperoxide reductase subunit C)
MTDTIVSAISTMPQLNKRAPEFNAKTTHGDRTLDDYTGKWLVLF